MNARVEVDDSGVVPDRSAAYRVFSRAFTHSGAQAAPFDIDGAEFVEAFDPSASEIGCSLREAAYADMDQSALFEELMRFYSFFGLGRGESAEMPDHLSVELEFMHFLTHLEREAAASPGDLLSLRRAQHDFLVRHVQRLVQGIRAALRSESPKCADLVELLSDFVADEIRLAQSQPSHAPGAT